MSPSCFSQRLFHPFQGTLQTVRIEHGEAESTDGVNWALYVVNENIVAHTGLSEIRYGSWSFSAGLRRSAVRGSNCSQMIEDTGQRLLATLEQNARNVPFPAADCMEQWIFDRHGLPLVWLKSALPENCQQVDEPPYWHPGATASGQFRSQHGNADLLSQRVTELARETRWVRRQPDGGRCADGQYIDQHDFPRLLLREGWTDPATEQLVQDFLQWQAPWLLQLDTLDRATRQRLEQAAWKRQRVCAEQYRLYPEIIDQAGLTSARVAARLMSDNKAAFHEHEPFYPFGNE